MESWFTEMLGVVRRFYFSTPKSSVEEETNETSSAAPTTSPAQTLLEAIRTQLQSGLKFEKVIEFACSLREEDFDACLCRVTKLRQLPFCADEIFTPQRRDQGALVCASSFRCSFRAAAPLKIP